MNTDFPHLDLADLIAEVTGQPVGDLHGGTGRQQPRQPGPPLPDAERLVEVLGPQPGRRIGQGHENSGRNGAGCHSGSSAASRQAQLN